MARVLVIDDEKLVALGLCWMLEDGGHRPILARSENAIFADLERCEYDIVLTDLNMPGVSGWDVADWLAAHRPEVPVVAVSGTLTEARNSDEYDRFAAVIAKGFAAAERLCRVVEDVIGERQRATGAER